MAFDRKKFGEGCVQALPILAAFLAQGVPFGILANRAGFPTWAIVFMSFIVLAGSSQFMAVQLLMIGSDMTAIWVTTFLINLRHLLLSASLSSRLPRLRKRLLLYLAHTNTDETYAFNISKKDRWLDFSSMLGTNVVAHLSWVLGSLVGALLGSQLVSLEVLDGVLPVLFATLLAFLVTSWRSAFFALLASALTLALIHWTPGHNHFLIVTLLVPTIALFTGAHNDEHA